MDQQKVISDWIIATTDTIYTLHMWLGLLENWRQADHAEPDDFTDGCLQLKEAELWQWASRAGGHGIEGQHTEKLGGDGDGLAIVNGRTTRFRAAYPEARDYEHLPRLESEPPPPDRAELAGDQAFESWQIEPDRLAYALVIKDSASAIREQFGGGTAKAMQVRDYSQALKARIHHWRQVKAGNRETVHHLAWAGHRLGRGRRRGLCLLHQ
jgi:hypothetical protein